MPSSLGSAIRSLLARYLRGEMSLHQFDEWFVPATWDVEKTGDQATIDLTYENVLRLAESSNGDCTESELKSLLRPLVPASAPSAVAT